MKWIFSLQVAWALAGLISSCPIWTMDSPLRLQNLWKQTFQLSDNQIAQTRFYQAIYEGNIGLVRNMVKNDLINPHRMLVWHSVFIFHFGGKDENTGQNYHGNICYLPLMHQQVLADPNAFKDCKRVVHTFLPLTVAITQNKSDIVKFFVEECKVNVNAIDQDNRTALHTALNQYNTDLVQYLLDHGANPLYKENSVHHHTVLESINYGLSIPQELKSEAIAKLHQIKPIVEQALATNQYQDPYSNLDHFHPESEWAKTFNLTQQQIDDTRFFHAIINGDIDLIRELVTSNKIKAEYNIHPVVVSWVNNATLIYQPISGDQFLKNPKETKKWITDQGSKFQGPYTLELSPDEVYDFIPSANKQEIGDFLESTYTDLSYSSDETDFDNQQDDLTSSDTDVNDPEDDELDENQDTDSSYDVEDSQEEQESPSSSSISPTSSTNQRGLPRPAPIITPAHDNDGNLKNSTITDQSTHQSHDNLTNNGQHNLLPSARTMLIPTLGMAMVLFGITRLYSWCMHSNTANKKESDVTDEHTTQSDTEKNLNVTQ